MNKNLATAAGLILLSCVGLSSCTLGSGTRTCRRLYQPTDARTVEMLFREPKNPYIIIGPVSAFGSQLAAENAVYRAVQKETAELGGDAVLIDGPGLKPFNDGFRQGKILQGLAIKWGKDEDSAGVRALNPTSTSSTTRKAVQDIPANAPAYPSR